MPGTIGELANALTALLLSGLVCAGVLTGAAIRTRRSPTLRRAAVTADSAAGPTYQPGSTALAVGRRIFAEFGGWKDERPRRP
jgi:hypothetical protein